MVDRNGSSLDLLRKRAESCGLQNLRVLQHEFRDDKRGWVGEFSAALEGLLSSSSRSNINCTKKSSSESSSLSEGEEDASSSAPPTPRLFDVGIGLHCCGRFSDVVLEVCRVLGASSVVCPCCNGKVAEISWGKASGLEVVPQAKNNSSRKTSLENNFVPDLSETSTSDLVETTSKKDDGNYYVEEEQFYCHPVETTQKREENVPLFAWSYPRAALLREVMSEEEFMQCVVPAADDASLYPAKCLMELDRALHAGESGCADVHLFRFDPVVASPKHHVIYCRRGGRRRGGVCER